MLTTCFQCKYFSPRKIATADRVCTYWCPRCGSLTKTEAKCLDNEKVIDQEHPQINTCRQWIKPDFASKGENVERVLLDVLTLIAPDELPSKMESHDIPDEARRSGFIAISLKDGSFAIVVSCGNFGGCAPSIGRINVSCIVLSDFIPLLRDASYYSSNKNPEYMNVGWVLESATTFYRRSDSNMILNAQDYHLVPKEIIPFLHGRADFIQGKEHRIDVPGNRVYDTREELLRDVSAACIAHAKQRVAALDEYKKKLAEDTAKRATAQNAG